jgi:hypothetical protein
LDMQPLHASFDDQDQAEEAIRKLASLRGNRFRMERAVHGDDFGSGAAVAPAAGTMNELAGELLAGSSIEAGAELGHEPPAALFSLSLDIPAEAAEQARKVIEQAGGRVH